jgi:glyoxylase-like metal-dependent hydrolase (beta-lactamase superfamily II)
MRMNEAEQPSTSIFAFLEPHHDEEVISYLVLDTERAALIDTGTGIGNIQAEAERLTDLPVIVVNTHAHVLPIMRPICPERCCHMC